MTPYYEDELVTLYHGDMLDVLPTFEDNAFGAVITDPPYGVGVDYGDSSDDSRPDYWEWMRSAVVEMRRVAPVVTFTHRVSALRELTDWQWVGVWNKRWSSGSRLGNSPILPHWEPIIMWGIHSLGTSSKFTSDVFEYNPVPAPTGGIRGREGWAKGTTAAHPTPKPPGLYEALILSLGQHAAVVCDPFAGSGTTLSACKRLGVRSVGIEVEESHCDLIASSLAQGVLFGAAS